jgi:hypothetical protein
VHAPGRSRHRAGHLSGGQRSGMKTTLIRARFWHDFIQEKICCQHHMRQRQNLFSRTSTRGRRNRLSTCSAAPATLASPVRPVPKAPHAPRTNHGASPSLLLPAPLRSPPFLTPPPRRSAHTCAPTQLLLRVNARAHPQPKTLTICEIELASEGGECRCRHEEVHAWRRRGALVLLFRRAAP